MTGSRGFSVVETLVATAIMLTVTGAVFQLLATAVRRSAVWNDDADVHQRARVATEALSAELRRAGAGGESGPLRNRVAAIDPRRVSGPVTASAITVRYVPDGSDLAGVVTATWYFDAQAGVIRREEPGHGDFPVVDAVADVRFEYFDAWSSLALENFGDGPWCAADGVAYDCDVLRIRRVRVTIALRSRLAQPMTVAFEVMPWNLDL